MSINLLKEKLSTARRLFSHDSLFRNATYLVASTAIMSALGFIFWLFVAHLYSPSEIGIASTLIAMATLISNISLLGLNAGLMRFLSRSPNKSAHFNAAALLVATITIIVAATYIIVGSHFNSGVSVLTTTWQKLIFIILLAAVSLNSLTDAVFIANRRGEYHTIGYATFGAVKLILPVFLVPFGSLGIYSAYIFGMAASLIISFWLMRRGCGYHPFTKPNWHLIREMRSYSTHNFIAVILAGLPSQLMPLFILRQLGAAPVAYFSMAWTMANLLYIIPSAVTQSLLAESAYDPSKQAALFRRTIRLLVLILLPAVTLAIIIAPYLLQIFGGSYRQGGTVVFQILALSTLCLAVSAVGSTALNMKRNTRVVVAAQLAMLVVTSCSVVQLIHYGLTGVGLSFLLGNLAACLIYLIKFLSKFQAQTPPPERQYPDSPNQVSSMLHQYGIANAKISVLTNGSSNRTLLVNADSKQWVLRIYRADSYKDIYILQEIGFMSYLADRGLPVPTILSNKHDQKLSHFSWQGQDWQYVLMEYMPGSHPSTYSLNLIDSMAKYQANIHVIGREYMKTLAHTTGGSRHLWSIRQLVLRTLAPHGYGHFDFDSSNVLATHDHVSAILDFEGTHDGPLVGCVYYTLRSIYASKGESGLVKDYLRAYQQTRKLNLMEKIILSLSLSLRFKNYSLLTACL